MAANFQIEKPDLYNTKKLLAIQPHYDDNDIYAGGTICALAEAGVEVVYLTCTDDLIGVIDDTWSSEEATRRLRNDQAEAAKIVGVRRQHWLGFPDAGEYNYFDLRREIMRVMRIESPDCVMLVDPWLAYEAHNDHIIVGKAASEAALLCGFPKIKTTPEVDAAYQPHHIQCVAYYGTQYPNTCFDISHTMQKKKQAVSCYHAQFHEEELVYLAQRVEQHAREKAAGQGFECGEIWKLITTRHLHGNTDAWKF